MSDTLAHILLVRDSRFERLSRQAHGLRKKIETFHSKLREHEDSLGDPRSVEYKPLFSLKYRLHFSMTDTDRRDGHAA